MTIATALTVHPWLVESPCDGCRALPHTPHNEGCDHTRCAATGGQYWCCDGEFREMEGRGRGEHEGACSPVPWDGVGPAARAAGFRSWYAELVPYQGWHSRTIEDALARPHAVFPDLNRVLETLVWDEDTLSYRD